ncbi:hypothetical protein [Bartonella bovis]|uniref:Uncharacterized protein n=1 Tax=Bartonella bovis 91-4 TaxID=1094491 RepID=N6VP98_9HYPH|nr:hypothetical protein [Bartonella bovis]ENN92887.1 hypothetical protein BBbe_01580 [Bartonella bovis 91-4]
MKIKHFGIIVLFILGSNSSVQGANLMVVKGLALNVATTFVSTDLHFDEWNSDSINNTILNISCTDQNKWTTNYGKKYAASLTQNNKGRPSLKSNKKPRRPRWSRIHPLSF